ncbi:PEP-CTERM sorting domain-containing protein [Nostoc sp. MS1]|uniref:PEP-CTERM sorting domain-containing protein n=1 Tax=Nostoc sp. MS1 TaxID=2764711 RepID=UPI001CC77C68|nr:PEP-CTERM sorting domain-containing protein [Nostoc sp. MS1]BCL39468.1 hypothetical protein NSMS1_59150 [Nostoc sp. MS1]
MKLLSTLALTTFSIALSLPIINSQSASAAVIRYSFRVDTPTTQGSGNFSFDDSTFANQSIPLAPVKSLQFSFNVNPGVVYTAEDDIDYPGFGSIPAPAVFQNVAGGSPFGLSFFFSDKLDPAINYAVDGYNFTVGTQSFSNAVSYSPVPEPSTLVGVFMVCGFTLTALKRR